MVENFKIRDNGSNSDVRHHHHDAYYLHSSRSDAMDNVKPRLLIDHEGTPYDNYNFHNEPWYKKLTRDQRMRFDSFITTDIDEVELGTAKSFYTVKELLRKIKANLSAVLDKPDEYGERETVLAGGYPRSEEALLHIVAAYYKSHNLKVYDINDSNIPSPYEKKLEQEEMLSNIEFHLGQQLYALGEVRNHDILIPHPGPRWIEGSLGQELNHILGPSSKAYVLTDTIDDQKNSLMNTLEENYPSLYAEAKEVRDEDIIRGKIKLGEIYIQPTHPGPHYVIEVSRK